jgi:outer membrane protein assembly factor BamB
MEDSAVIWRGHMIVSDNGGLLMCLDLNTLQLEWVQDILDDSNGSPVLSIENGHPYIYISTSFPLGWRSSYTAPVPIFKIDAENGEIVWRTDYTCYSESGVSGGVQSTMALGKNKLEGYVYVTVAKTDRNNNGILACLDRETGEIVWEHHAYYTWSSPVLVYGKDGTGYLVYCNYGSRMYLMDALTGELLDTFYLGGGVEASPAVFENTVVIGTRQCRIWGVKMS